MSTSRSRRPVASIERPRLSGLLGAARLVVLEAPSGYGKTTVALRWAAGLDLPVVQVVLRDTTDRPGLLAALEAAFRRAGLLVLADSVDPADATATLAAIGVQLEVAGAIVVVIDEMQRAQVDAAEWIAELARTLPSGSHLLVAGRRIPGAIFEGREDGWTTLDIDDLGFDFDEVEALLSSFERHVADASEVASLLDASRGWPAAVALAAATRSATAQRTQVPVSGPAHAAENRERLLRQLMEDLLTAVDDQTRVLAFRAAQVPLLSEEVAAVLGGAGAMARLADAGLPIRFRGDGWAELPDTVGEYLGEQRLPLPLARSVAAIYAARGELAEALSLLARTGDQHGVLALIADEHPATLGRVGLGFLDAIISQTPDDALAEKPQAIVQLIRAAERSARLREAWFARASLILVDHTEAWRAVEAERAFAEARAGELAASMARAEHVIAESAKSETTTMGRAYMVRAYGLLLSDTAGATTACIADFEHAVAYFQLAGERAWEAEAHQAIGFGCLFSSGATEAAMDRLERSLALRSAPDANRSQGLTYYAEVLGETGRYADAEIALREARAIARRLGDERSIGYAAWSIARLAGLRRDQGTAVAALAEAEDHPGEWFSGLAGTDFLADAAVIRMRIGDVAGALRDIEQAEARAANTARSEAPLAARARYEAVFGDAEAALDVLNRLDRSPVALRSDRWHRVLLRAVALARGGNAVAATAALDDAQQIVADDGDPERITRQEPDLLALIRPSAPTESAPQGATIVMLGGFAVTRGAVDVTPSPGRPSTLVKLLALRGTVSLDEVIDILWPETDLELGRARLRNLLSRIRTFSGDLVDRRGEALALRTDVIVDAVRFEKEAAAAIAAPFAERAALSRRALTWSTGELLPEDRYAEWADLPRERLARRRLDLLDLVANDAISRGDLVETSQLLDAAIADDPLDEMRYVRLARALLAQGRSQSAADVIRRAVAVAGELGVEPGDEVRSVLAEVEAVGHAR